LEVQQAIEYEPISSGSFYFGFLFINRTVLVMAFVSVNSCLIVDVLATVTVIATMRQMTSQATMATAIVNSRRRHLAAAAALRETAARAYAVVDDEDTAVVVVDDDDETAAAAAAEEEDACRAAAAAAGHRNRQRRIVQAS
jgi:hypothetical protein